MFSRSAFFLLLFTGTIYAQQKHIPLSHDADWLYNFIDNRNPDQQPIHSGFRPIIENADKHLLSEYSFRNSIGLAKQFDSTYIAPPRSKFLRRKLKQESLIIVNDTADKFHLTIDPLFIFQASDDLNNPSYYTNTRGFIVRGDVGKNLSFESSFYENQSTFPSYISDLAEAYKVVPGQGRWKRFKTNGYDYAMASGYLSYTPNKHINLQIGHGKNFVGDGYRSLLLSDNAFNYPYLRTTTTFGHFQYTNLYAVFINLDRNDASISAGTEALFQKKAVSFQYLSWNAHKRIQLGLFQGMIWQAADSKNKQNLNLNYFDPVILTNTFVYSFNNTNNILLGATAKIKVLKNNYLYGEYVLDDYDPNFNSGSVFNKQGFQLGFKAFDLFKIKNLNVLLEYNQVRPYTYAALNPEQSYSHYNQPLAHPLGANFKELTSIINFRHNDFIPRLKIIYAQFGDNFYKRNVDGDLYNYDIESSGKNIFASDFYAHNGINSTGNSQNQGTPVKLINIDFSIGQIINPITNMSLSLGYIFRSYLNSSPAPNINSYPPLSIPAAQYIYISFKTSLSNLYYDF